MSTRRYLPTVICAVLMNFSLWCGAQSVENTTSDGVNSVPEGMIAVPAGKFWMGTSPQQATRLAGEYGLNPDLFGIQPYKEVELPAFFIDRHEVTNRQYREFVEKSGHRQPVNWQIAGYPDGMDDYPVVGTDYADAIAYAQWAGKRLPTEAEWEKAARGMDGRLWPWGNEWDPEACRMDDSGGRPMNPVPSPAGAHPRDRSVYGAMDLAGNVPEWVEGDLAPDFQYTGLVKGGGFLFASAYQFICAARVGHPQGNGSLTSSIMFNTPYIGFRCAKDAPVPSQKPAGFVALQPDDQAEEQATTQPAASDTVKSVPTILATSNLPRPPDPSRYQKERIKVLPVIDLPHVDIKKADASGWPKGFSHEAIAQKMDPWRLEIKVPYLPDDRFGILLENFWQHNAPVESANFNDDFTMAEITTTVHDWNLKSRIRLEGKRDCVDIVYENQNLGDQTIPGSQEMCLSTLGTPNFRDHDGVRTFLSTEKGMLPMTAIWHHVNDRIYCQNFMLPADPPPPATGPTITGPFIALTSRDGQWLVAPVSLSDPPNRLFNNREYSCLHCNMDSSIGPRQTRVIKQRIYFLKGGLEDLAARYEVDREYQSTATP